jgi:tetratricopeptide (TPR) repeat protein
MRYMHDQINYFGHLGDGKGFFSGYVSHLTDGYGAVVFTNGQNGINLIREIMNGIAKVYDWKLYLPEEFVVVPMDPQELEQYCGRFAIGSDASFEITKENNRLFINKFGNAELFHVGNGKFVIKFRLGQLQFKYDENDKVLSAVYHFSDEVGRFLNEPVTCTRLAVEKKLPIELLHEGKINDAVRLYEEIKNDNPTDPYISENRFNSLGYQFMGQKKYEQAIAVLKLNVKFYPESSNCYDSLAEAYMLSGNNVQAIKNYKKVLELNPDNQNAIQYLKKLQNE